MDTFGESQFQDRSIICVDCEESFLWSSGAQQFHADKGLQHDPKRCPDCKKAKNARMAAMQSNGHKVRVDVPAVCAQCGAHTTIPFYPTQGRPVYCRDCFIVRKEEAERLESLL